MEKFLANNFTLTDAEDNSESLNREVITDLPLLKTLFTISPESQISGK